MIENLLKKIQEFGPHLPASVTITDIQQKEKSLGIKFPDAVRELYTMFPSCDPLFSVWLKLIPLNKLQIKHYDGWCGLGDILPFLQDEEVTYAYLVRRYNKTSKEIEEDYISSEDAPAYMYYTNPKTKWDSGYVKMVDRSIASWIVACIGFQQILAQPSVVSVPLSKELGVKNFEIYNAGIGGSSGEGIINIHFPKNCAKLLLAHSTIHPLAITQYDYTIGAQSDDILENFAQETKLPLTWLRSQSGHKVKELKIPEPPEERELISIEPILKFICECLDLHEPCVAKESLQRAEIKIGQKLPLPLAEYYQYMPKSFYEAFNTLRPLSSLRLRRTDGIMAFLIENQGVYDCGVKLDSPFIYQRWAGEKEWVPIGIMDGYLAAEFIWNAGRAKEKGIICWECPNFEPELLEEGGALFPNLSDIADGLSCKVAAGNYQQLYNVLNGKVVGLYNKITSEFFMFTRDPEALAKVISYL